MCYFREDKKTCTIEVRAGAGGAEACLFTEDILNMYKNYCSLKDWKVSTLTFTEANGGGYVYKIVYYCRVKEAILRINGEGAYGTLRTESGVHVW